MAAGDGHKIKRLMDSVVIPAGGSVLSAKFDARNNHRANPVARWVYNQTDAGVTGITIEQLYYLRAQDEENSNLETDIKLSNEDPIPDIPPNTLGPIGSPETKVFGWNSEISVLPRILQFRITNTDPTNAIPNFDLWVDS